MLEANEILEHIIAEREVALSRARLLNEVIDVIQNEGYSNENLQLLKLFLEASNKGRPRKILTISSKMNVQSDLLEKYPGYSETKNVKDKVVIILETEARFLHIKEIAEILKKLDFDSSKKIDDYIKNISPVVSTMAKKNDRICKISADGNKKTTIWGLQIWMENGQPKNDFLI